MVTALNHKGVFAMQKSLSITLKMSIALGIIQILEYSVPDVHLVSIIQLVKIAIIFMIIGHSLPKEIAN